MRKFSETSSKESTFDYPENELRWNDDLLWLLAVSVLVEVEKSNGEIIQVATPADVAEFMNADEPKMATGFKHTGHGDMPSMASGLYHSLGWRNLSPWVSAGYWAERPVHKFFIEKYYGKLYIPADENVVSNTVNALKDTTKNRSVLGFPGGTRLLPGQQSKNKFGMFNALAQAYVQEGMDAPLYAVHIKNTLAGLGKQDSGGEITPRLVATQLFNATKRHFTGKHEVTLHVKQLLRPSELATSKMRIRELAREMLIIYNAYEISTLAKQQHAV